MGKSVAVNFSKKLWKEPSLVLCGQMGKTERQAWGNLPVPPLWRTSTWNMKVWFPEDKRGKNKKPHPVAFQLTGKQKPDLVFFASIADWGAKRKRFREETSRLNWAVLYHHLLLCHHGWHILCPVCKSKDTKLIAYLELTYSPKWIWITKVLVPISHLYFTPCEWLIMVIWDLGGKQKKGWEKRDGGKERRKKEVTWEDFFVMAEVKKAKGQHSNFWETHDVTEAVRAHQPLLKHLLWLHGSPDPGSWHPDSTMRIQHQTPCRRGGDQADFLALPWLSHWLPCSPLSHQHVHREQNSCWLSPYLPAVCTRNSPLFAL